MSSDNVTDLNAHRSKLAEAVAAEISGIRAQRRTPGGQETIMIDTGREYTTPSAAVADALAHMGFDDNVVGKGPIEVRIIAEFQEGGAMFHAMGASSIVLRQSAPESAESGTPDAQPGAEPAPTTPEVSGTAASTMVLRSLAEARGRNRNHYMLKATVAQMNELDLALDGISQDEVDALIAWDNEDDILLLHLNFDAEHARSVITALTRNE